MSAILPDVNVMIMLDTDEILCT